MRQPAGWARHAEPLLRAASLLLWSLPALRLLQRLLAGSLGANPLDTLLHTTGQWALTMLLVTLAVTPLRRLSALLSRRLHTRRGKRLSDWNWLVRLRRQFGLFAFFYASLHLALYAVLDAGLDAGALRDDLAQRPYLALGAATWTMLLPLAATSNRWSMQRLGRHWRLLHRLSWLALAVGLGHVLLQMKPGQHSAWPYAAAAAALASARAVSWLRGERQGAQEVPPRH